MEVFREIFRVPADKVDPLFPLKSLPRLDEHGLRDVDRVDDRGWIQGLVDAEGGDSGAAAHVEHPFRREGLVQLAKLLRKRLEKAMVFLERVVEARALL